MFCKFEKQVSMLIDGELDARKRELLEDHIQECDVCRSAHQEFLELRQELGSYPPLTRSDLIQGRLEQILGAESQIRWWQRRISVPVPVLAALIAALLTISAAGLVEWPRTLTTTPARTPREAGSFDISDYDRGGRAALYRVPRARQNQEGSR